jgi:hypothetical protein
LHNDSSPISAGQKGLKNESDCVTANARPPGSYQADALQNITGAIPGALTAGASASGAFSFAQIGLGAEVGYANTWGNISFDASRVARTSSETRGPSAAVAAVVLI